MVTDNVLSAPSCDIDSVLTQMAGRQARLATDIARHWPDLDDRRLARLLHDWYAINGPPPTLQQQLISGALAELGAEWGIDLLGDGPPASYRFPPVDIQSVIADLDAMQARLAGSAASLVFFAPFAPLRALFAFLASSR